MTTREVLILNAVNLGDGKFSDRNGMNQITFEIPKRPAILNGKSLRMCAKFKVVNGDGTTAPQNRSQFYQDGAITNSFFIDSKVGVNSVIDVLSIQNLNGQTYSTCKNYSRLCSSLIPLNESFYGYINGGCDTFYGANGKDAQTAMKCDSEYSVGLPLYDGLLQGQPYDLELLNGCRIVITLNNSNYVINNNYYNDSQNTSGKTDGGAYYELSEVLLYAELEVPDEDGQTAMKQNKNGVIDYNTYTSFYNVIQSTDHNINLNINTGRTLSVISNLIPSSYINNYDYNSSMTRQLLCEGATAGKLDLQVNIDEITFLKSGIRVPLDYEIETEEPQDNNTITALQNFNELSAIRNLWRLDNFLKSQKTELSNLYDVAGVVEQPRFDNIHPALITEDHHQQFNIGVNYDDITYNGLNFKGTPLGIRIQSSVPPTKTFKPHSYFIFVKNRNTLVVQDGVINVLS